MMLKSSMAAALICVAGSIASGQITTTNFGCSQNYSVSPPSGQQWTQVLARQFAHSWFTSAQAGTAWQVRPGNGPADPPQQSSTFAFIGVDNFVSGTIFNSCVYPCTPPRTGDIARTKDTSIATTGTTPGGIGLFASVPGLISNSALSRVEVAPYSPAGPVSMTLSTQGQYQTVNSPPVVTGYSKAYAFSQVDLRSSVIPPSVPGGTLIATSWSLGVVQASRAVQAGPFIPAPPTARLWDPVRFVADNTITGEQTTGEILSIMLDLDGEGEVRFTPALGLWIDATDVTFEMACGGEFVKPDGRLRIRVAGGVVAEASATGAFGAATMPPIGAPVPINVFDMPVALTLLLDLGGVIPDPYVVTITGDHAGLNPIQTFCPADVNFDGVVDFNDFLEFLNYFNEGSLLADLNHDGVVDFNDLLEFLNAFNEPC